MSSLRKSSVHEEGVAKPTNFGCRDETEMAVLLAVFFLHNACLQVVMRLQSDPATSNAAPRTHLKACQMEMN